MLYLGLVLMALGLMGECGAVLYCLYNFYVTFTTGTSTDNFFKVHIKSMAAMAVTAMISGLGFILCGIEGIQFVIARL